MELWRGITVDRAGGVMLEFRDDKFACGFCWMIPADPCLRIGFELFKRRANAIAVRLAHTVIPAYQCS